MAAIKFFTSYLGLPAVQISVYYGCKMVVFVCAYGRSLCSLVCKWLYEADKSKCGWNKEFMSDIGLADLAVDGFQKIGKFNSFQLYFISVL